MTLIYRTRISFSIPTVVGNGKFGTHLLRVSYW